MYFFDSLNYFIDYRRINVYLYYIIIIFKYMLNLLTINLLLKILIRSNCEGLIGLSCIFMKQDHITIHRC